MQILKKRLCLRLTVLGSLTFVLVYQYVLWQPWNRGRDPCTNIDQLEGNDPKLVSCLKHAFLSPPSPQPYNLSHPNVKNPSQYGQNLIAHKLLNYTRNGFFIECGALDGELYSNTLYLERQFGWTGVLIEAEATNYENLLRKRRKAWTSPACLSPKTTAEKLTLVGIDFGGAEGGGGLTLMQKSVALQRYAGYVNSRRAPTQVQCFPLYTYLLALNVTEVDYFSLDIEGADFEILKTIPFDKVIFKVLEVEVYWVNEGKEAVKRFLEERGYVFVQQFDVDYIFVHNTVLKKLLSFAFKQHF